MGTKKPAKGEQTTGKGKSPKNRQALKDLKPRAGQADKVRAGFKDGLGYLIAVTQQGK